MRRKSIQIVAGQFFWAIAQALVIVLITKQEYGAELAGIYGLAVAVYTPICLLAGLNLRNLLAIDGKKTINSRAAVVVRVVSTSLALMAAYFVAGMMVESGLQLLLIILLLSTRLADQVSDIAAGVFQRDEKFERIALSYFCRGVGNLIPLVAAHFLNLSFLGAAAVALFLVASVTFAIDLNPLLKMERRRIDLRDFIYSMKAKYWGAPFQFLDSLHSNSLRYAASFFLPLQTIGVLSVAQTIYAPVQMIVGAVGYTYIIKTRKIFESKDGLGLQRHALNGALLGLFFSLSFFALLYFLPRETLLGVFSFENIPNAGEILLLTTLSMLPMSIGGLPSQILIAIERYKSYSLVPFIGVLSYYSFLITLIFLKGNFRLNELLIVFAASYILRVAFSIGLLFWKVAQSKHEGN